MLTKGDDFPIHQTPEPIAYSGSDRNFYDRYFFNGYSPDGERVRRGGLRGLSGAERRRRPRLDHPRRGAALPARLAHPGHGADGPHGRADPHRGDRAAAEAAGRRWRRPRAWPATSTFEGRAFPIEEPRFTRRNGPRMFMDYTRLTQNVRVSGWTEVDGERRELAAGWTGTRDRSWGIRPVGAPDPQPTPGARHRRASSGSGRR